VARLLRDFNALQVLKVTQSFGQVSDELRERRPIAASQIVHLDAKHLQILYFCQELDIALHPVSKFKVSEHDRLKVSVDWELGKQEGFCVALQKVGFGLGSCEVESRCVHVDVIQNDVLDCGLVYFVVQLGIFKLSCVKLKLLHLDVLNVLPVVKD
jgi:hypothetical protein